MGTLSLAARLGRKEGEALEYRLEPEDRFLYDAARGIDQIDPYVGVGASLMVRSEDGFVAGVGVALNVAEAALFKVPFIARYYRRSRDLKGTLALAAKTCLTTFAPDLAFLQLLPANYWMVKRHLSGRYSSSKGG